ncbi:unnamed protein product [Urochloa decumbens]|uniref:Uncharacterized protein n=1 Tax=Urochloa decumbens TaxID=240449 RepID=A0ABC9BQQ3_9POAL
MDAVVVKGERRKAAAADGSRRRPLVPSERNNAAAPDASRRREVPSRFKPVAPPAAPELRRCASSSAGQASAADGSASCNRARSADRARPAAPSSAATSSRLKPSALAVTRSSSPARDAPRARSAKASDGLWVSARNSPPSVRPEPVPASATTAKKIHRLVNGLPSSEQAKLRPGAAAERKRSPLRGSTNNTGGQCENARPSESPADMVTEQQHRWPGMMAGRGSAGLTSTSSAPAENTSRPASSANASAGCSPRRTHPSEGMGNLKRLSNKMAKMVHRRRKDKADSSSDTSSQTSESSKSTCQPSKAISSPVPFLQRSKSLRQGLSAATSTSRSCQSPSRTRPSAPCRSKCDPSAAQSGAEQPVFNYIVDARKGKKNAGQIENVHQLRLLNNRYLQWRFVNALSEDTLSQKNGVENTLYSVWKSILTQRDALIITRINVQHLHQELNLYNILTEQIGYLEQWLLLEEESTGTVVEAIEALQACTLCLPVTSGAQADGIAVRNAISSAVDVMQALSSSIFYLQSKVEDRTSLVSELLVMARQEKVALDQCKELLSAAAKLQETSLHTFLMQLTEGSAG